MSNLSDVATQALIDAGADPARVEHVLVDKFFKGVEAVLVNDTPIGRAIVLYSEDEEISKYEACLLSAALVLGVHTMKHKLDFAVRL